MHTHIHLHIQTHINMHRHAKVLLQKTYFHKNKETKTEKHKYTHNPQKYNNPHTCLSTHKNKQTKTVKKLTQIYIQKKRHADLIKTQIYTPNFLHNHQQIYILTHIETHTNTEPFTFIHQPPQLGYIHKYAKIDTETHTNIDTHTYTYTNIHTKKHPY